MTDNVENNIEDNEWEITDENVKRMSLKNFKNLSSADMRYLQDYVLTYGEDPNFPKEIYKVWEDYYNRKKQKTLWFILICIMIFVMMIFPGSSDDDNTKWDNFFCTLTECMSSAMNLSYHRIE